MEFIRHALEAGKRDGYIDPKAVMDYVDMYSSDRRYKLKWFARDFYIKGCSSGIIGYRNAQYYFNLFGDNIELKYA